jgi:serine phosphatase RsbU (regulator of sigma subunit)
MSGDIPLTPRRYAVMLPEAKYLILTLFMLAMAHHAWSQPRTPLPETIRLYDQAVASKDHRKAAQYAYDIARHYNEAKDFSKSIDYLDHAVTYAKRSGDAAVLLPAFNLLGTCSMEMQKYTRASESFQSALGIARQQKDTVKIKEALVNLSKSYGQATKYKRSIEYAAEALALALAGRDTRLQLTCYQLLASYYSKQGDKRKADEYTAQYNLLVNFQRSDEQKKSEVKKLQQHLLSAGREKIATQSQLSEQAKKLAQTNDSLRLMEGSLQQTTDSLRVTEAISKNRQLAIDLLQKDKELAHMKISEQEARIRNEALIRNSIVVGTLLSVALIIVLIISYRRKLSANKKIEKQNKNITSSINYARRIQEAMLPRADQHPGIFSNAFILFQPRDTVSGDFYWLSDIKVNDTPGHGVAFASVDCTGHGVPGAFMSMIGINALNSLISRGITDTDKMLHALNHDIRTALKQEVTGNNDGMDIALCIYHPHKKVLEFSGAKSPLVYIRDNQLFQVKGDIHSIGGSRKSEVSFKKHEITIDKPTWVYLFSDGYKDQFGGKDNTKFMARRLNNLLLEIHQLPMKDQQAILQKTLTEWKGSQDQTDDILVMGIHIS